MNERARVGLCSVRIRRRGAGLEFTVLATPDLTGPEPAPVSTTSFDAVVELLRRTAAQVRGPEPH